MFENKKPWLQPENAVLKAEETPQPVPEAEQSDMQAVLGYEDCVKRYRNAILNGASKKERHNLMKEAERVAALFHNGKEKTTLLDIASGKW